MIHQQKFRYTVEDPSPREAMVRRAALQLIGAITIEELEKIFVVKEWGEHMKPLQSEGAWFKSHTLGEMGAVEIELMLDSNLREKYRRLLENPIHPSRWEGWELPMTPEESYTAKQVENANKQKHWYEFWR